MPTITYESLYAFQPGTSVLDSSAGDLAPGTDVAILDSGADTLLEFNDPVTINGAPFFYYGLAPEGPVFSSAIDGQPFYLLSDDTTLALSQPISINTTATFPVCFAPGTLIATPTGDARVENLVIGNLVMTADGRVVPVKWIGRQTVLKVFAGERARPVRVAAGALGEGLPYTDLVLTADHALILDGLAINAGALVNGTTITLEPLASVPDRVTYYHVETEDHDVILANGAAAETFVDYVGRRAFDNHAEYVALYGDERIIAEMPLFRISTSRLVPPALKARLNAARTTAA